MKHIEKTCPPEEFVEYCKTPGVSYDGLTGDNKKLLRKRLLEDQGYICCYCGCEIEDNKHTKIEHIKCQEKNTGLALKYENMLVSCDGGDADREKRLYPKHQIHCDAKKGTKDIPISPLEDMDGLFVFYEDGDVKGKGVGKELITILGLDVKYLRNARREAIESYEILYPEDLEEELEYLKNKHCGKFEPFCFVLEQYIEGLIKDKETV